VNDELEQIVGVVAPKPEDQLQVLVDASLPAPDLAIPTPEQIKASDALFVRTQEADQVANFLGLWTCATLFADLVGDRAALPTEEERDKVVPRLQPEPPPV